MASIATTGYKVIQVNGVQILEHRHIMQKFLNRKLRRGEIVHHKNHNRLDNRIENLELMTQESHAKHHHPKRFCEVSDCGLPRFGNGYCAKHYQRLRIYGNAMHPFLVHKNKGKLCEAKPCNRKALIKGACGMHNRRMTKHGSYELPIKPIKICSMNGCIDTKRIKIGLCNKHYISHRRKLLGHR